MERTQEDIQKLKDSWVKDPCWDIETTEGFESHHVELLEFRIVMEQIWSERILAIKHMYDSRQYLLEQAKDNLAASGMSQSLEGQKVLALRSLAASVLAIARSMG